VDPVTRVKSCYADKGSGSFSDAQNSCQSVGGYVLNTFSFEEIEFVYNRFVYEQTWIGLTTDRY
jgi:hypothetical protein